MDRPAAGMALAQTRTGMDRRIIPGGLNMSGSRTVRGGLLAVLAAAALPFVSCGGGGGGGGVTNPPPPSGGGGGGTGGTPDVIVTIVAENGNMSFSPNPVNVTRGQRVAWRNSAGQTHTATENNRAFDTGNINGGNQSGAIEMGTAGTFAYHCAIHPAMVGTVNVQ
jgi:plastocyanin